MLWHSIAAALSYQIQKAVTAKTSIITQQRHPHTGHLNSETPGDNQIACLHCGDALDVSG